MHNPPALSFDGFRELTFAQSIPVDVDVTTIDSGRLRVLADQHRLELEIYDWNTGEWNVAPSEDNNRRKFAVDVSRSDLSSAGEIYFRFSSDRPQFMQLLDVDLAVQTT
jgi:hypothetical protein